MAGIVEGQPIGKPIPTSAGSGYPITGVPQADGSYALEVDVSSAAAASSGTGGGLQGALTQEMRRVWIELRELRRVYCERTGAVFLDLDNQSIQNAP